MCAICQQNRWRTNGVLTDKCCSCGFVKAKDQYFLGDFNKIYSDQYYQLGDYYNYRDEEQALKRNFRNRLNKIRSYKNSGNLLDIGCGYGFFLEEAKTYYNVLGVERNPELAEKISGRLNLPVKGGDFSKTFFDKNFDVITAFDVVEVREEVHKHDKTITYAVNPRSVVGLFPYKRNIAGDKCFMGNVAVHRKYMKKDERVLLIPGQICKLFDSGEEFFLH